MIEAGFESLDAGTEERTVFMAETFLNDCEADPTLGRIVLDDESWIFEYGVSPKCQSMQWKRSDELQHKRARMA